MPSPRAAGPTMGSHQGDPGVLGSPSAQSWGVAAPCREGGHVAEEPGGVPSMPTQVPVLSLRLDLRDSKDRLEAPARWSGQEESPVPCVFQSLR